MTVNQSRAFETITAEGGLEDFDDECFYVLGREWQQGTRDINA